ncbi:helix-turn-helix domain-containing protein [Clostridium sp. 'White wine YQ']|uniref:helix-turn-helix domain-containing protein n=1 Tax=Clostridium sp. 'White wine YQ' TaxID=3027474 RepID=UPI00236514C6|nr:helix-turn-helix domain-containing protein [Clostridium sp. 'White wine YQ']MDD7793417.1 helix-turn-helix domain-containing protein [Clostridium sp. 'White wine YQ']
MDYKDIMQKSIDYIEENLKSELSANEIAQMAGFSLFHYYRLFQNEVGIPVMQYVLKRKLCNAIYEISLGNMMIEVALSYGFDTHSGFFRAFKREYDCSPTEYLKNYKVVKPYRVNLKQKENIMITEKKIKEKLKNWDLIEPIDIKSVYYESNGNKSDTSWIINNDFIIKIGTNISGLKQHIAVSKALAESGFEVAIPILTKDKKEYIVDEDLYFCLTNRIQGEVIKSIEIYDGEYESKAKSIGEAIGRLHLILQEKDNEVICNDQNLYEAVNEWAIPIIKQKIDLSYKFYEDYQENFKKIYPHLVKHVIHRDPNPNNIIVKDGMLRGFIDFELSERNVRIFDPCYVATAILSESFDINNINRLDKWLLIFKNIIRGYDSVCKLSLEEKKAIPYVVYSIQMIFIAYLSDIDKFQELSKINHQMFKWLVSKKEEIEI